MRDVRPTIVRTALVLTFAACVTWQAATAGLAPRLDIETLSRNSQLVVTGSVASLHSFWNPQHTLIYTRVIVAVDDVWIGSNVPATIEFEQLGGAVGNRVLTVMGSARFRPGERVLLFLREQADGTLAVTGRAAGKLQLTADVPPRVLPHPFHPGEPSASSRTQEPLSADAVRALVLRAAEDAPKRK